MLSQESSCLRQETGHILTGAITHVPCSCQFLDTGIYEGEACLSLAPSLEPFFCTYTLQLWDGLSLPLWKLLPALSEEGKLEKVPARIYLSAIQQQQIFTWGGISLAVGYRSLSLLRLIYQDST